MSLKKNVFSDPITIKYKGIYDFDGLYKLFYKFFNARNYYVIEPKYKDKAGKYGNDVEYKIIGQKEVTDFVKYMIQIETEFIEMEEVPTTIDGQRKMVSDGRFFLRITDVVVEFDWQNKFSSDFQKKLLNFMVNSILRRYFEFKYIKPLKDEFKDLQKMIKSHLNQTAN